MDDGRGSAETSRAQLTPWRKGDPRARAAALKGAEARRKNAEARRVAAAEPLARMEAIASTHDRAQLGPMAVAVAMWTMSEVVAGRQRVPDPAAWVRALVDVARLEAGEVTSATAHVEVTADDVRRAVELRESARRALGNSQET